VTLGPKKAHSMFTIVVSKIFFQLVTMGAGGMVADVGAVLMGVWLGIGWLERATRGVKL